MFAFLHTNPLKNGVYSTGKEFAPNGSKFFLLEYTPEGVCVCGGGGGGGGGGNKIV